MTKATGPTFIVPFRRKRKGLTNYAKRLALVKSHLPRMVVRKTGTGMLVQFVNFEPQGDKVVASVHSTLLKKFGWVPHRNAPTAYLAGLACARAAGKKGVKDFVLDIGMYTPSKGSIVFAALKGAIDAGLKTAYQADMVAEKRINGSEIATYAKMLKQSGKYDKMFSAYVKAKVDAERLPEIFEAAKKGVLSSN